MKKTNPDQDEKLKTCWSTMLKYIGNVAKVSLYPCSAVVSSPHMVLHIGANTCWKPECYCSAHRCEDPAISAGHSLRHLNGAESHSLLGN